MNFTSKLAKRGIILLAIFIFLALIVVFALFRLQILHYDEYQDDVINQFTVETNVNPARGYIYDRNGITLACNQTVWVLYLLPKNIENPELISKEISTIIGKSYDDIYKKACKKEYKYQKIDTQLNSETTIRIRKFIEDNSLEDQIELRASSKRYYPYSNLASHTIGFVNADGIGIYGLEKVYNNFMEGTNGKYITAQDAQSNDMPFQYEEFLEDEQNYNLVTTLDLYIQYQLEEQLEMAAVESGATNRATGIVMNPKTGEIYAMATYPNYNLNNPYKLDEDSQKKLDALVHGSSEYKNQYLNLLFTMWNNKAVSELYEPGSTFKLFTTAVALQEKKATLDSRFTCTGSLKIDGFYRAISCHKRKGHGNIDFAEALQQSCNPSMMKLGFAIGRETFYKYFERFGYMSRTGIDLPAESIGYYHSFNDFSNVSLAVYSFGQTFKTTALQQLCAISAIANGGYKVTPHFIKEIVDNEGTVVYEYENRLNSQIISNAVCSTVSQILKEGVDGAGGAKNAYVPGYSMAAKTGTSEKKDKLDEEGKTSFRVSSCVAYAPSEDAQVAVIILVDEPTIGSKYGSVVAAPYVSNLMELILPYLGIKPNYSAEDIDHQQVEVCDFYNLTVDNAIELAKKIGINYEIIGFGERIISQTPQSGSVVYKKSGKIILYTEYLEPTHGVVPSVVGMNAEKANSLLINNGFNIEIEGAMNFYVGSEATVVEQYPASGTSLKIGDVVKIKILFTDDEE